MEFNLRGVDLNLLPVFEAAYEERSLSRAAVRLGMTQPAMSHALNRLRLTFKDELFIRHPRGMTPTPIADQVYPRLRLMLDEARRAISESAVFDPALSARRFFISIPHPLGPLIGLALLERLARLAPLFMVSFSTRSRPLDLVQDMRDGKVDLALDWIPEDDQKIKAEVLFHDRLVAIARKTHPLQGQPLSLAQLQQQGFVALRARSSKEQQIETFRQWQVLDARVVLEVSEFLEVLLVVGRSDLLALAPQSLKRIGRGNFDVKALELSDPIPGEIAVWMSWHERRDFDPAHIFLRQQLREVTRDIIANSQ